MIILSYCKCCAPEASHADVVGVELSLLGGGEAESGVGGREPRGAEAELGYLPRRAAQHVEREMIFQIILMHYSVVLLCTSIYPPISLFLLPCVLSHIGDSVSVRTSNAHDHR